MIEGEYYVVAANCYVSYRWHPYRLAFKAANLLTAICKKQGEPPLYNVRFLQIVRPGDTGIDIISYSA